MKFSGKMCFKMILKLTKNQSFTLSLENTEFSKNQIDPPPLAVLELRLFIFKKNDFLLHW